jgi:phenylacetate-coenzyme A ligase PaaK-like adenylate-forming protein
MIESTPFLPRARLREIQERNLRAMLDLCFARHLHYRSMFARAGIKREDITGIADLHRLPITTKQDYMADPESFRLDTTDLAPEMQVFWDVMHTTGTSSGKPTPFYSTAADFYAILTANRRALEIRGVVDTDIIANLCPMTLHPAGAYHRTVAAASAMKIPVVSLTPGRPSPQFHWASSVDESLDVIVRTRATILWGVASYVRRIVLRAQERGADLRAVRLAFVMGEPVTEAMRADIARRLMACGATAPRVSVSYAATEMQVGAVECRAGSGYHNPAPEQFLFEIVDPLTHAKLPDGARGLVVMTHLMRSGTVLLRYALGDLSVLSHETCPHCGATTDRFVALPQRADDMLKIRGQLVNPSVLLDAIAGVPGVGEFQAVIERERDDDPLAMDRLRIRVAATTTDFEIGARLADAVKAATGVRPQVEFAAADAIYDAAEAWKSKRIVDRRRS